MTAGKYTFQFDAGADVVATLTWYQSDGVTPVNITGYSAALTLYVPGTAPVILTQSSGLTLGGAAGTIAFDIAGATTADWGAVVPYALFLTSSGGTDYKLLYGDFIKAS